MRDTYIMFTTRSTYVHVQFVSVMYVMQYVPAMRAQPKYCAYVRVS